MLMRALAGIGRRVSRKGARQYRRILTRTRVIGVTGSLGKTTTKELISVVLRTRLQGRCSRGSENTASSVAGTLLSARPHHDFCLLEIGINPWVPNPGLDTSIEIARPDVAVVTCVSDEHRAQFPTHESVAAEKGKLVSALDARGTAVLNYDDPYVRAMAGRCKGTVVTYGTTRGAEVHGEVLTSSWPDRLALRISAGGGSVECATQLCGGHWVSAVLAAMATGRVFGISLRDAADAIAVIPPTAGRMSPETHPDGVTFIRDDWKAGWSTLGATIDFLRTARATRKIMIVGTVMHLPAGPESAHYEQIARDALGAVDHAFFVGSHDGWAKSLRQQRDASGWDSLRVFADVKALVEFLRSFLRDGDLVLVKGSHVQDHLERVVLDRGHAIRCWRRDCGRHVRCYDCEFALVAAD
jgi:UDP-N-acetylmuramoyl-tripeptide--D-alanyl-D-alanine ligase